MVQEVRGGDNYDSLDCFARFATHHLEGILSLFFYVRLLQCMFIVLTSITRTHIDRAEKFFIKMMRVQKDNHKTNIGKAGSSIIATR